MNTPQKLSEEETEQFEATSAEIQRLKQEIPPTLPTEDRDWKKDIDILAAQGHIDADGVEKVFELIAAAEARGYERGKSDAQIEETINESLS